MILDNLVGKRIKLLDMKDDPSFGKTLHKGDRGIIESIDEVKMAPRPFTQVWVKFDNGSHIALILYVDKFEVV